MKNCLIVALPRSGSTNLLFSISRRNKLKGLFEPFHKSPNIYSHYYKNTVCKMIIYRLEMEKLINFSKNFEKVVLLSRRDIVAASESFVAMRLDNNSNSLTVWNEVSDFNKKHIPYYTNKMTDWSNSLEDLSKRIGINIDYYEDVYSNKSLQDKDIKLDLEYFDPSRKLRGKKDSVII
jgi:hypothetical protein